MKIVERDKSVCTRYKTNFNTIISKVVEITFWFA